MGVCFSEGVAAGHLLAAERGRPGERYILCDRHVNMRELSETVVRVAGRGRVPPALCPRVARVLAGAGELVSRAIGKPPLLPSGQLTFLLWDAAPDSSKAQDELGWQPTASVCRPLQTTLHLKIATRFQQGSWTAPRHVPARAAHYRVFTRSSPHSAYSCLSVTVTWGLWIGKHDELQGGAYANCSAASGGERSRPLVR